MRTLCAAAVVLVASAANAAAEEYPVDPALLSRPGVLAAEMIWQEAPFPSCHASTIVETSDGLIAAWFGGTDEGHRDVGIWVSHREAKRWTAPVEVADGVQSASKRYPCWNPVLFQPRGKSPLLLFYKVGPSPREWWGELKTSSDQGKTWSAARRLPDGILGPIKNKPIQLADGDILCGSSTEHAGWRVHFERTSDLGKTWKRTDAVNDGRRFGAIQPTILSYPGGRLQALNRSRQRALTAVWSSDAGETWGDMTAIGLPNPNAGADGVTLADGRQLLVYNHTVRGLAFPSGRNMLNIAVSRDGKTWQAALVLELQKGEYSYPAVIQTRDGRVHTTYTYRRRRIKHVVIDPAKLELRPIVDGKWPFPKRVNSKKEASR